MKPTNDSLKVLCKRIREDMKNIENSYKEYENMHNEIDAILEAFSGAEDYLTEVVDRIDRFSLKDKKKGNNK